MAAAAIKVASAAQGQNHSKKKHNKTHNEDYAPGDPNDKGEGKSDLDEIESAMEMKYATTGFFKYQRQARELYIDKRVEVFVAFLIGANFVTNIVEKTVDPMYGARGIELCDDKEITSGYCGAMSESEKVWWGFALFYNIAFTIELAVNMYGLQAGVEFWKSGWNLFDFVVVAIGVIGYIIPPAVLGPFALLRMMRAFRVFRLFKRVKSLNKILVSLARAVPGVMNAFLIMLIVMCIYAILGVEFYKFEGTRCRKKAAEMGYPLKEIGPDSSYDGDDCYLRTGDDITTTFGSVYFGNFMKSLYSLFQVLTGDSWSEAIGRPLMTMHWYSTLYFVSFILLNAVVLINVVVAVLLEKMVDEGEPEDDDGDGEEEEILSTEERLEKLEESQAHIAEMLKLVLAAHNIDVPPVPQKLAPKPLAPAPAAVEQAPVTSLTGPGGGPSRVDYTDPKDEGLLADDATVMSASSHGSLHDADAHAGAPSMQILGC